MRRASFVVCFCLRERAKYGQKEKNKIYVSHTSQNYLDLGDKYTQLFFDVTKKGFCAVGHLNSSNSRFTERSRSLSLVIIEFHMALAASACPF